MDVVPTRTDSIFSEAEAVLASSFTSPHLHLAVDSDGLEFEALESESKSWEEAEKKKRKTRMTGLKAKTLGPAVVLGGNSKESNSNSKESRLTTRRRSSNGNGFVKATSAPLAEAADRIVGKKFPPSTPLCLKEFVTSPRSRKKDRGTENSQMQPCVIPAVVSEWVVEEKQERDARKGALWAALLENSEAFHRRCEPGSLADAAEERYLMRNCTETVHPLRDEEGLIKASYTYGRLGPTCAFPPPCETPLEVNFNPVRLRTMGYSPGHVRSLSPTPLLNSRSRTSSPLGFEPLEPSASQGLANQDRSRVLESNDVHAIGSVPARTGASPPPFLSPRSRPATTNHLGHRMTSIAVSRSIQGQQPYLFDAYQRRTAYSENLKGRRARRDERQVTAKACALAAAENALAATESKEEIAAFEERVQRLVKHSRPLAF